MIAPEILDAFGPVADAFEADGVSYDVGGSVASPDLLERALGEAEPRHG